MISCESLDELAAISLRGREDRPKVVAELQEITNLGMAGKLPFDESLAKRLALFAPNEGHIREVGHKLLNHITPSFWENREWLRQNADRIYVISGGFEECIRPVVEKLGLRVDHILANAFIMDGEGQAIAHDTSRHLSKAGGKVIQVRALNLSGPVIAIGDGYTDYEIRANGQADSFWYFAENIDRPTVREKADHVAYDLNDIIRAYDPAKPLMLA